MKRLDFIKSLGALAGVALAPKLKSEKLTLPSHTSDADHKFAFRTDGVERLRITSSGNLGIWAGPNPDANLDIYEGKGK